MPVEQFLPIGREMVGYRGINIMEYNGSFPQELDGKYEYTVVDGKNIEIKTKNKIFTYPNVAPTGEAMVEQILAMLGANNELVKSEEPIMLFANVSDAKILRAIKLIQAEFGEKCQISDWNGTGLLGMRGNRLM